MEITAAMVKELRTLTGAGVLDCRKTLEATNGDFERAAALLREKGLAQAAKKAERTASEGLIGHYVHTGSKVAALVEVNCESDFVARTEQFQALCKELAMQVVASRPSYPRIEDIPAEVMEQLQAQFRAEVDPSKPAQIAERIVEGKLAKYYEDNILMEQVYIKDDSMKIKDLIKATIAKLGENIVVRRFTRLEIGG